MKILLTVIINIAMIVMPVSANSRFEQFDKMEQNIDGLTTEQVKQFNQKLEMIKDMFASIRFVNEPPGLLCTRLTTSSHNKLVTDSLMTRSMAMGGSGVSLPAKFDGSKCSDLTNNGVGVSVNSLAAAFPSSERISDLYFTLPLIDWQKPGITAFKNGKILITREDTPFYLPVTKQEYLSWLLDHMQMQTGEVVAEYDADEMWQQWINIDKPELIANNKQTILELQGAVSAEELSSMQQMLDKIVIDSEEGIKKLIEDSASLNTEIDSASEYDNEVVSKIRLALKSLSVAQKKLAACIDVEEPYSAGPDACNEGTMVIKPNPKLFSAANSPADIRLLLVSPGTGLNMLSFENPDLYDLRIKIYKSIDLNFLSDLVD